MTDETFESEVLPKVLANEATCRVLVKQLQDRGVQFTVDPSKLTHEALIEAVIVIVSELKRRERK